MKAKDIKVGDVLLHKPSKYYAANRVTVRDASPTWKVPPGYSADGYKPRKNPPNCAPTGKILVRGSAGDKLASCAHLSPLSNERGLKINESLHALEGKLDSARRYTPAREVMDAVLAGDIAEATAIAVKWRDEKTALEEQIAALRDEGAAT